MFKVHDYTANENENQIVNEEAPLLHNTRCDQHHNFLKLHISIQNSKKISNSKFYKYICNCCKI